MFKNSLSKFFTALTLVILTASVLFAHGVGYRQSELKSLTLEFFYSTGEKMSYCEVSVFSPEDSKFAVQTGRTDEKGRFAFIPDNLGIWKIIVKDYEGHQANAEINITQEFWDNQEKNIPVISENNLYDKSEIFIRALLGVSLIFNIACSVLIFRRKNAHK